MVNPLSWAFQFFKEAWVELARVSWPSRQSLLKDTALLLLVAGLATLIVGLIDLGLTKLVVKLLAKG